MKVCTGSNSFTYFLHEPIRSNEENTVEFFNASLLHNTTWHLLIMLQENTKTLHSTITR